MATWIKEDGTQVVAKVLYKCPSDKVKIDDNAFTEENFQIEYYESDFPGLLESVADSTAERIAVEVSQGVTLSFNVDLTPKRKGDGKTITAILTPVDL